MKNIPLCRNLLILAFLSIDSQSVRTHKILRLLILFCWFSSFELPSWVPWTSCFVAISFLVMRCKLECTLQWHLAHNREFCLQIDRLSESTRLGSWLISVFQIRARYFVVLFFHKFSFRVSMTTCNCLLLCLYGDLLKLTWKEGCAMILNSLLLCLYENLLK